MRGVTVVTANNWLKWWKCEALGDTILSWLRFCYRLMKVSSFENCISLSHCVECPKICQEMIILYQDIQPSDYLPPCLHATEPILGIWPMGYPHQLHISDSKSPTLVLRLFWWALWVSWNLQASRKDDQWRDFRRAETTLLGADLIELCFNLIEAVVVLTKAKLKLLTQIFWCWKMYCQPSGVIAFCIVPPNRKALIV